MEPDCRDSLCWILILLCWLLILLSVKTVSNMPAYRPDYLFRTVTGVLEGDPSLSLCAKDLQDGLQIMALGNGPKQDWAC